MNGTTFHLTRSHLDGPAERTLVQPWIGELSGLSLNAYPDESRPTGSRPTGSRPTGSHPTGSHPPLTVVEPLPPALPRHVERIALAA
ncbi:hypothetical protein GCM10009678_33030 [Actinomadura kijaniata]|uniref:Uncharacterized protein n=1 Tax=Actinomadura namibiensis TaxID=182080 RepID=A0A7W3QL20_ACTNM|nr:hypothetical protein [Actinomadura namibiensis]MBA8950981.1 hypothetical protein [Actinomadura namibiensis]